MEAASNEPKLFTSTYITLLYLIQVQCRCGNGNAGKCIIPITLRRLAALYCIRYWA